MANKQTVMMSLLDKIGVEHSAKISEARAQAKIKRAIEKNGLPEDIELTEEEITLLKELGYELDVEDEEEEEEVKESKKKDEAEEEVDIRSSKDEDEDKEEVEKEDNKKEKEEKKKKMPDKSKKIKKMNKYTAVCTILKKRKNHTMKNLAKEANELYVKNDGKNNEASTLKYCQYICNALQAYNILTIEKDNIKIL